MGVLKFLLVALVTIFYSFFPVNEISSNAERLSISIDSSKLLNGDLIFRKGLSLVSKIVLIADNQSSFTHVGIVIIDSGKAFVIHSVPDESEDGIDRIKIEPVNLFLERDRAENAAVFRLCDSLRLKYSFKAVQYAKNYLSQNILFDESFDLYDNSKLYCTELVWKVYRDSGIDLVNNRFEDLNIPFGHGPYLLPGSFIKSPYLINVPILKDLMED